MVLIRGRKAVLIFLLITLLLSACSNSGLQSATSAPTSLPASLATPDIAQILAVTPEATPIAEFRIADADLALSFGDFDRAMQAYAAVTAEQDPDAIAKPLWSRISCPQTG